MDVQADLGLLMSHTLCTVGIVVPQITCFIVHCRYFWCDVAGVAHPIMLRFHV